MDVSRLFKNFQDVETPKECKAVGEVPEWLKGSLLRNGPGMFEVGDTKYKHWFDGPAYIQRYHFEDGKMFYSARFLQSDDYKANMKSQRIVRNQFGTYKYADPCKNIYQRFFSFFFESPELTDNCAVAFNPVGDGVYAVTETARIIRIDPDTLETLEHADFRKYLSLNTYTAHSHSDEEGNVYNIGTRFGKDSNYVFGKTENPLNKKEATSPHTIEYTSLIGEFACTDSMLPTYYHSFGMSQNYMLLFESPVRLNVKSLLFSKLTGSSYNECMTYDDSLGVNALLMDKKTGKKLDIEVTSSSFFTFHHANTFEKDGFVVADYCRMRNPGTFQEFNIDNLKAGALTKQDPNITPFLHRMIIPLSIPKNAKEGQDLLANCSFRGSCTAVYNGGNKVHCEDMRICAASFEFPRYNYEHNNMKEYTYCYGSSVLQSPAHELSGIIKSNVKTHEELIWKKDDASHMCAEPIFVLKPNAKKEDDGVLIVPIMTVKDGDNPFVVILDATNLTEMCRFIIPEARIPLGFHAHFHSTAPVFE